MPEGYELIQQLGPSFVSPQAGFQYPSQMYAGPDVMAELPPDQTAIQPGMSTVSDPTREVFDMLWAASREASKKAHQKAVDAEVERLRTEQFLSMTADQLKAAKLAIQTKNMMYPPTAQKLNVGGVDVLSLPGAGGSPTYRFPPVQKKMFAPAETVTEGGKTYRRQTDPNTGREYNVPIGVQPGTVPPETRLAITSLNNQKKEIAKLIATNSEALPFQGEMEKLAKDPKRTLRFQEAQEALRKDTQYKADLASINEKLAKLVPGLAGTAAEPPDGESTEAPTEQPTKKITKEVARQFFNSTDPSLPIEKRKEIAKQMAEREGWTE